MARHGGTEPLSSYRPGEDYPQDYEDEYEDEYEYEEERAPRPRILWGRVLVLLALLAAVFVAGRVTAPGPSQGELDQLQAEVREAREQTAELRQQLETTLAQLEQAQQPEAPPQEGSSSSPEESFETYTVKPGDSLASIAERFYGDPEMADLLQAHNRISDPYHLEVGLEIEIPPAP